MKLWPERSEIPIYLDGATYDALKAEADRVGGVGSMAYYEYDRNSEIEPRPCCIMGIAHELQCTNDQLFGLVEILRYLGITTAKSDQAVWRLLGYDPVNPDATIRRVPFDDWAHEMNIVRT